MFELKKKICPVLGNQGALSGSYSFPLSIIRGLGTNSMLERVLCWQEKANLQNPTTPNITLLHPPHNHCDEYVVHNALTHTLGYPTRTMNIHSLPTAVFLHYSLYCETLVNLYPDNLRFALCIFLDHRWPIKWPGHWLPLRGFTASVGCLTVEYQPPSLCYDLNQALLSGWLTLRPLSKLNAPTFVYNHEDPKNKIKWCQFCWQHPKHQCLKSDIHMPSSDHLVEQEC